MTEDRPLTEEQKKKLQHRREKMRLKYRSLTRNNPKNPQWASRTVGRNQKCPCGSGKKYKRCHALEKV